ncbi:MAG: RNB domain-containing ribonuclease [Betaproteobacteria bacterium]|nr:RNB domain-containing ribonuclease [Betaproteobacteria bacterium]NBP34841.1 RNB domain-containing ribonuclease [Betaproteobacteria bacterium]NBP38916.1 RNB domain-containing ribonuclease [Betaproteobacteria bacterium]NBQ78074.1 RNB domain-containing ribonuclease [Betaproteobacteria bacterium]NBQ94118.1 RNB domain-containing ribonuclease [Betaproteobacteria bacterium]
MSKEKTLAEHARGSGPFALFEEEGHLRCGKVIAEAQASLQVEQASGRRSKVKHNQLLLRFSPPAPQDLLGEAKSLAAELDVAFIWEVCSPAADVDLDFVALASEYFGRGPNAVQACAMLMCLQDSPIWFLRRGRGLFRPQSREHIDRALQALERRRRQDDMVQAWAKQLAENQWPQDWLDPQGLAGLVRPISLLLKPDKQSLAYRALELACQTRQLSAARLLLSCGQFASPLQLHQELFAREQFPKGLETNPPPIELDRAIAALKLPIDALDQAAVEAFSIDDSSTTEIDDALSLSISYANDGQTMSELCLGVHIAAPAMLLTPESRWDAIAKERMSTVYAPGQKIQMLPEAIVRCFSLDEGRLCPALSLYVRFNAQCEVIGEETRLEKVKVVANLRHDQLESSIDEEVIEAWERGEWPQPVLAEPVMQVLGQLWRLAKQLQAEREIVRGRPEPRFRSDFHFRIEADRVEIEQRRRDAPLDRIVAEMMILANSRWGRWLALNRLPGIFRSQSMGRARMTTHPIAHQGLGVGQYVWATSPLRRYADLVNQRQLLALATRQRPPFLQESADLHQVIAGFDARYDAYSDYQSRMERYWSMRWLQQLQNEASGQGGRFRAVALREQRARLRDAPLVFALPDMPDGHAGRGLMVAIVKMDLIDLTLEARMLAWDDEAIDANLGSDHATPPA